MPNLNDDGSSDDDIYRPSTVRRSVRSKRTKINEGRTAKAKRESISPALTAFDASKFTLQALLDPLTALYAEESAESRPFEDIIAPLLEDYAQAKEAYRSSLLVDELGRWLEPLSELHEERLIAKLSKTKGPDGTLSPAHALLLRKLKLQQHRRAHHLPSPSLRVSHLEPLTSLGRPSKDALPPSEVLDALHAIRTTPYEYSFLSRIHGMGDALPSSVVFADWETRAPWMDLMEDIRTHYAIKCPSQTLPDETEAPITYVTLTPAHLPQVHDLLHRAFWEGVNVTDSLRYEPEKATIVATYKQLVVGCAFLSSPQETYITYLVVRAGWEQAQIATTMLYHLISRNPYKDITLHVSANNSAMLLYNRFGFKAEEFIVGFYADYLDPNARSSKNAFRLRLRR